MNIHDPILPDGWPQPKGYSNGILAQPGRMLFVAGQVGWDSTENFQSEELPPQFKQALLNVTAVLEKAGAKPEHICRMTCFCTSRDEYLASRSELGQIWKEVIGSYYPSMSMIFVTDLLDHPAKIEIETTAVIPD